MTNAPQYRRAWQLFAVGLTVLLVIGLLTQVQEPTASTLVALAVTILSLNGLFGLGWQRPLFRKWVWQVLVALQAFLWVPVVLGLPFYLLQPGVSLTMRLIVLVLVALEALILFGLYQYAFRSSHLWRRSSPTRGTAEPTRGV
jgi:hypothetical protein